LRARKTGVLGSYPTPQRGKDLIAAFRKHSGQMRRVFFELSPEGLRDLEAAKKKLENARPR